MQREHRTGVALSLCFSLAFCVSSLVFFGLLASAGSAVTFSVEHNARLSFFTACVLVFAICDVVVASSMRAYAFGPSRQTSQALLASSVSPSAAAVIWGLDTGFVVTTFRVTMMTWTLCAGALLGLTPWWLGAAYGVGFCASLLTSLWRTESAGACALSSGRYGARLDVRLSAYNVRCLQALSSLVSSILIGLAVVGAW